jgi:hypothetical protein
MLADRMMRGEEGSEFKARHGFLSKRLLLLGGSAPNYGLARAKAIAESRCPGMVGVQTWTTCRRPEFPDDFCRRRVRGDGIKYHPVAAKCRCIEI